MKNLVIFGVLALSLTACGDKGDSGTDRTADILALSGDSAAGETIYTANCSGCHGADGAGSGSFPAINGSTASEEFVNLVLDGAGSMPSFSSLGDQDIADVFAYIGSL